VWGVGYRVCDLLPEPAPEPAATESAAKRDVLGATSNATRIPRRNRADVVRDLSRRDRRTEGYSGRVDDQDKALIASTKDKPQVSRLQCWLCPGLHDELDKAAKARARRRTPSEAQSSSDDDPKADPDGVAALLSIAEDAIDDERGRGRELDDKMASLVGFIGLILSVNVAFAVPLLDSKLGPVGNVAMRVGFLVAVLALLLALLIGVVGVLSPQKYRGLGSSQMRDFTSVATQAMNAITVHQSMLGALADILEQDRPVNNCKAKLTKQVAAMIAIGFLGVTAEALTLVLRKIGL
jgi:hypothetical protein